MNFKSFGKAALTLGLFAGAMAAYAGVNGNTPGGSEFDSIWELIQGWSQGVLGRIIALGALIVGIAFGLVRQSVVAAVIGISMAIVLQYGPDVIEGIVTSTAVGADLAQVALLDNGMDVANLVK